MKKQIEKSGHIMRDERNSILGGGLVTSENSPSQFTNVLNFTRLRAGFFATEISMSTSDRHPDSRNRNRPPTELSETARPPNTRIELSLYSYTN